MCRVRVGEGEGVMIGDMTTHMTRALLDGQEVGGVTYPELSDHVASLWNEHSETIEAFGNVFYQARLWNTMRWCGVPLFKTPADLWAMQELFWKVKPTVVIETGTMFGGSALYYADLMTLMGERDFRYHPRLVLTIDCEPKGSLPEHPLIEYRRGDSIEEAAYAAEQIAPTDRVLVCLDSDHSTAHVLREMEAYAPCVTVGSYLIVEDTALPEGPGDAVQAYLAKQGDSPKFWPDHCMAERLFHTFHPNGYLWRVA